MAVLFVCSGHSVNPEGENYRLKAKHTGVKAVEILNLPFILLSLSRSC